MEGRVDPNNVNDVDERRKGKRYVALRSGGHHFAVNGATNQRRNSSVGNAIHCSFLVVKRAEFRYCSGGK